MSGARGARAPAPPPRPPAAGRGGTRGTAARRAPAAPQPPARGRGGPAPAPRSPGRAAAPASGSCARCEAARRAQRPPCSLRTATLSCQHCGRTARAQYAGLSWGYVAARSRVLPINGTAPIGADDANHLHVVAAPTAYQETVTLAVTMAACADPAQHPHMTLLLGTQIVQQFRGQRSRTFTLGYPSGWFAAIVQQAARPGGILAIRRLFFPSAREYQLRAATCGSGPTPFNTAIFRAKVFPGDKFKLSFSLPAFSSSDSAYARGTENDTTYQERQRSRSRGGNQQESTTARTTVAADGSTTRRLTRAAGTGPGRTITQGPARRDVALATLESNRAYVQALQSTKLERNQGDISDSFGVRRFMSAVQKLRETIDKVLKFFRDKGDRFPQVGWRMSFSFSLLSGSFSAEWGWKESPASRLAYRWVKLSASLTILRASFTVSFGASVAGAVAKIEAEFTATLSLSGSGETTHTSRPTFEIDGTLGGGAQVRVVAGWEGTLSIEGRVNTGLDLATKLRFTPAFAWTMDAHLRAGTGTGTICVFGWERSRTWSFWERRQLGETVQIL